MVGGFGTAPFLLALERVGCGAGLDVGPEGQLSINALLLASGISLLTGWLPSAVNPADAPSRQRPVPPPLPDYLQ